MDGTIPQKVAGLRSGLGCPKTSALRSFYDSDILSIRSILLKALIIETVGTVTLLAGEVIKKIRAWHTRAPKISPVIQPKPKPDQVRIIWMHGRPCARLRLSITLLYSSALLTSGILR